MENKKHRLLLFWRANRKIYRPGAIILLAVVAVILSLVLKQYGTFEYNLLAGFLLFVAAGILIFLRPAINFIARAKGRRVLMEGLENGQMLALAVERGDGSLLFANALFKHWFPEYRQGVGLAVADKFGAAMPDIQKAISHIAHQALSGHAQHREIASSLEEDAQWYEISVQQMKEGILLWQMRDMTGRKKQFERAADRLALLARALDRAPFGIVIADRNLIVKEANTAFRKFLNGENVVGRDFLQMIAREEEQAVRENLTNVLQDEKTGGSLDVMLDSNDGFMVSIHAIKATLTRNGQVGLLLYIEDLRERKRLEMQFAQSQKMQAVGQLAGGIAHDFNNMLTAIIGFCDLLLQRHQPGNPSFSDSMQIKQNANRAAGLVRQLLAFARQQTSRPRVFNLSDILAELAILLRRLLGDKIELEVIHGRDLGYVKVDQGQMEQAIINLAVNARDAMPDGGKMTIKLDNFTAGQSCVIGNETMPPGDYVMVSICDDGEGIAAENLERLFEPFYTTKEVGQNTGLGLSMVYGAIRQAGGFVFAHSDGPGKGATFTLYIRRAVAETVMENPAYDQETGQDDTGGGCVLLVEDEDPVRLFAARALRAKGYVVTEARTGETALEILAEENFDLLVTDMMMPKVDGATLIRESRKILPDLPVICMSGYTQETVAYEVAELPRVYFLAKPFSLKQLARKVKDAIDSS